MTLLHVNSREAVCQELELLVVRVIRLLVAPGLNLIAGYGSVAQHPVREGVPRKRLVEGPSANERTKRFKEI